MIKIFPCVAIRYQTIMKRNELTVERPVSLSILKAR